MGALGPPNQHDLTPSVDALVETLRESYVRGLNCVPLPAQTVDLTRWVSDVRTRIGASLPHNERVIMVLCKRSYTNGRRAASEGDTVSACRWFGRARQLCASQDLSGEHRLLCEADLTAAEAYLDYCSGHYMKAAERLHESLRIDLVLETVYNHPLLQAHRVHVLTNLIRVTALTEGVQGALRLARDVLQYLAGRTDQIPGLCPQNNARPLSPGLVRWLIGNLFTEVAFLSSSLSDNVARNELTSFFTGDALQTNSVIWDPQVQEWFALKASFLTRDYAPILAACSSFLEKGPRQWRMLWLLTALDACAVSAHLKGAIAFRHDFNNSSPDWSLLPRSYRHMILSVKGRWTPLNSNSPHVPSQPLTVLHQ